ncbi:MAG: type II secretion system major pseudopilin GspG [Methylobacter sp.]|uniref:Type II secretion system core protein G n=1 Tax=Candidatus Methylobacter titanis TaxID=3053457 RepID=A0AA43Q5J4_9GAMM|nr:type II secretion system major pseudopilin GspG [Candidatus Methylobacter titanis]MDI1291208.1 type II secretion system major pseudopilin GspG [Candidatus Methylobacter titanis]
MKQLLRFKAKGEKRKANNVGSPHQRGFTLLELLVVLGIIAMLAGIVGPQVMKHMGESKTKAARVQIEDLAAALDMYKLDLGSYPTSEQGLMTLIESPDKANRWNGPYLRKSKMPLDPWQQEYRYVAPGEHGKFDLYTLGADGKEGGEGEDQDIASWE